MPMINTKLKLQIFIHKVNVLSPEGHNISEGTTNLCLAVFLSPDVKGKVHRGHRGSFLPLSGTLGRLLSSGGFYL